MKLRWMILSLIFLVPMVSWGQYRGGPGGSYGTTTMEIASHEQPILTIFSNPVPEEQDLEVVVRDIITVVEWELWDLHGRMVGRDLTKPEVDFLRIQIPNPGAAGMYMLKVVVDGKLYQEKVIFR